jgi:hypothetical protein
MTFILGKGLKRNKNCQKHNSLSFRTVQSNFQIDRKKKAQQRPSKGCVMSPNSNVSLAWD